MHRPLPLLLLYSTLSLVVACSPAADPRTCGAAACGKGTRCDAATQLCVVDTPPIVHLAPLGEVVSTAAVSLEGSAADDVGVTRVQVKRGEAWEDVALADGYFTTTLDVAGRDFATVELEVRAFDALEHQGGQTQTVRVDNVGPALAAWEASDGGVPGRLVHLVGRARDGSGAVASVTATAGDQPGVAAHVEEDGAFAVTLEAPEDLDLADFPVTLSARDGLGNEASVVVPVMVDTASPSGSIEAPADGDVVGAAVEVRGTVLDSSGVREVRVASTSGWVQAALSGGRFSASVGLAPGDNVARTVAVEVVDSAGNVTRLERSVVVDTVSPHASVKGPAANDLAAAPSGTLSVTVQASDGAGRVDSVSVTFLGATAQAVPKAGTDLWVAVTAVPLVDFTAADLVITALDRAGNSTVLRHPILVDRVAPVVAVTWPPPGTVLNASQFPAGDDVTVTWTESDADAVGLVRELDGVTLPVATRSATLATHPTDDGVAYGAVLTVRDSGGNTATATVAFTVDRVAPTLTVTSPSPRALVGGSGALELVPTLVARDGTREVAAVTLRLDGPAVSATRGGAPGAWSGALPLPLVDAVPMSLAATARDAAGNETVALVPLTVDRVPPVVTFLTPAPAAKLNLGDFPSSDDVSVGWRIVDGAAAAGTESFSGVPVARVDRAHLVRTSPTDDGVAYTATVVASDPAGNRSTATLNFSVDRVRPRLLTMSPDDGARNVEARQATVRFSERVQAQTGGADALFASTPAGPLGPGTWSVDHATWTSALAPADAIVTLSWPRLADDAGNELVLPPGRRFHAAVATPSGVLATDVSAYDAASDQDGVLTLVVKHGSGDVESRTFDAATGAPVAGRGLLAVSRPNLQRLQAYAAAPRGADGVTPRRFTGATTFSCVPPLCAAATVQDRVLAVGAAAPVTSSSTATTPVGLVLAPAMSAAESLAEFGAIDNKTYRRGSATLVLGTPGLSVVAGQSRWASVSATQLGVSLSEVQCPAGLGCSVVNRSVSTSPATGEVSSAMSPSGQCLVLALGTAEHAFGAARTPAGCSGSACSLPPPAVAVRGPALRVAPFAGNGEDAVLLLTADAGGVLLQKQVATPGCDANLATLTPGVLPIAGTQHRPIQLGNAAAILYIDPSGNLRVKVP